MSHLSDDTTSGTAARRFSQLAFATAACTYALIVFGGIVRITGSGMGCGDDWPLCNGKLIPPFDFETLIEYGHRLAAALVGLLVLYVAVYAFRNRRDPVIAGRGILPLALTALVLLIAQVMVGAATVRLELPAATVVLHLVVAASLLAILIIAGLRARTGRVRIGESGAVPSGWIHAVAILAFVVFVFGGLVANTGASPLCLGFPLCNGRLVPENGALVHLHWTHRLLAYALVVVVAMAAFQTLRRDAGSAALRRTALLALILVAAQIIVAAAMVLARLPNELRVLHLAVGTALWATCVIWAALPGGRAATAS